MLRREDKIINLSAGKRCNKMRTEVAVGVEEEVVQDCWTRTLEGWNHLDKVLVR